VLAFASTDDAVYAGTVSSVLAFDWEAGTWQSFGSPPLFDYHGLHLRDREIFVCGVLSPPQRWTSSEGWVVLDTCPSPVRAFTLGWDDDLLVSTPDGVFMSEDHGETWQQCSAEHGGDWITVRNDGAGWVAAADGSSLALTRDRGRSWAALPSPFGVLPVVALQAPRGQSASAPLLAATFDATQQAAVLWRSYDEGETWQRGAEAFTPWPTIATLADPLAVSVGAAIILSGPEGIWMRTSPGGGAIRKLSASIAGLAALTTEGIWLKRPDNEAWQEVECPVAIDHIIDIGMDGAQFVALLAGGDIRSIGTDAL
jgi:hypothetical protein